MPIAWSNDIDVLVSLRTSDPTARPARGSTTAPCDDCGAEVWLAPASARLRTDRNLPLACSECGLAAAERASGNGATVQIEAVPEEKGH